MNEYTFDELVTLYKVSCLGCQYFDNKNKCHKGYIIHKVIVFKDNIVHHSIVRKQGGCDSYDERWIIK